MKTLVFSINNTEQVKKKKTRPVKLPDQILEEYEAKVIDRKKRNPNRRSVEELKLLSNPIDTPEDPLTHDRLMQWLADTGWVYGYIKKRISPMDAHLYEDYAQTIWLYILEMDPNKILEVWYHGKGQFVNYIKKVIDGQLMWKTDTYKLNKHYHHVHKSITPEQWHRLEEGESQVMYTDNYPVKCDYPTGNRKKMVTIEYEDLPIDIESMDDIIDYNSIRYTQY